MSSADSSSSESTGLGEPADILAEAHMTMKESTLEQSRQATRPFDTASFLSE